MSTFPIPVSSLASITAIEDYGVILSKFGIISKESNNWLYANGSDKSCQWKLHISVTVRQVHALFMEVLPVLQMNSNAFRCIRNMDNHFSCNNGNLGFEEIGKVITVYPEDEQEAISIAKIINQRTDNFCGPQVYGCKKIGAILFAEATVHPRGPAPSFPSSIDSKYRLNRRRSPFIGKYFIPISIIRTVPKGVVYKAINLTKCRFSWCLIKQGRAHMVEDRQGRSIFDRLRWQQYILEELSSLQIAPRPIDFFEIRGDAFLVMEYIEGINLTDCIQNVYLGKTWLQLQRNQRILLLGYFQQLLGMVRQMHEAGYVHRDISSDNFMLDHRGRIMGIDFELVYCLDSNQPDPAFSLGTHGYISPQQLKTERPVTADDIFSLGALLLFFLTGTPPKVFLEKFADTIKESVFSFTGDKSITTLILHCLCREPARRPSLETIQICILNYKQSIQAK